MATPYSNEVYCPAGSMYWTTGSATISTTTGDYGPSTGLEEMKQNPTAAQLGPAHMYSQPMFTPYQSVPYHASGFVYGIEYRALEQELVHAEFGHMMRTQDNAQLGSTQVPPAAPQSTRASCLRALCCWRDESTSGICRATLSCKGVPDHFKDVHGIKQLKESERVDCRWKGCSAKDVGRKNFVRHIREHHLKHSRDKGHSA